MDAALLEVLDNFEQLLQRPAKAVEAGDAKAVAGPGMIDQLGQGRALGAVAGDHVREDADGTDAHETVLLTGRVPVGHRDARLAESVAFPGGGGRLFNEYFRDGSRIGRFPVNLGSRPVSCTVSISSAVPQPATFWRHTMASLRLLPAAAHEILFGIPSDVESLERNCVLAEDDIELIATRRSATIRLGLEVHIALLCHPGQGWLDGDALPNALVA